MMEGGKEGGGVSTCELITVTGRFFESSFSRNSLSFSEPLLYLPLSMALVYQSLCECMPYPPTFVNANRCITWCYISCLPHFPSLH